jgi:hypothetical protein
VSLDAAKLLLDVLGVVGAAVAFVIGLIQYRRAQQWKRAEFLAKEMKELGSDLRASTALTMVDWAVRRIRLYAVDDSKEQVRTLVTYAMQAQALRPHVINDANSGERAPGPQDARDGANLRVYSREEALIRDCYDALLDRMERLGAYLEGGLLSVTDVAPYVSYYINDIAATTTDAIEALWTISLFTYVHFYHFTKVPVLFREFNHDISPNGSLFGTLMKTVAPEDRQLAETLQSLAVQEFVEPR